MCAKFHCRITFIDIFVTTLTKVIEYREKKVFIFLFLENIHVRTQKT